VKVLIVNAYSARNRGDGMIVSQMVRLFRERGCDVKVMSDDPRDGDRYDVERLEPLAPIWPSADGGPSKLAIAGRMARDLIHPRALGPFRWADVCVSAGGGYLYDDGSRTARLNAVRRLLPLRAARGVGTPVVLFSQSIGPFRSPAWRSLVAGELRRAQLVIVREELSLAAARAMGLRPELCDDVAFTLKPAAPPRTAPTVPAGTVGVTVMNALPGVDADGHRRYADALRDGLIAALRAARRPVAVISQVSAHAGDDDVTEGERLRAALAGAGLDARFMDLGDAGDEEVSAFYGRLDLVVASRLHSGILALCAGTPIVALSYLPKTDGVLARLGLERWVLPAAGLDAPRLTSTLAEALAAAGSLRADVAERLPAVRESARRAVELTLDVPARSRLPA
jgi:polysaccharide pyruvyl transferase WcaK-like protein